MATRKICVDEVTTITRDFTETISCSNPAHTPTGPGDDCRIHIYDIKLDLETTPPSLSFSYDSQFEYAYDDNGTFMDYCTVKGNNGSVALPAGVNLCCNGALSPDITTSVSCDAENIETTPTTVSGKIDISFTITNLCTPKIICVDDITCP